MSLNLRYKDIKQTENLPQIQRDIIKNASAYVKAGGTLIYSTCTVLDRENGAVVRDFLENNPDFYAEDFVVGGRKFSSMTTLMPDTDKTDGFFIAHLKRKK